LRVATLKSAEETCGRWKVGAMCVERHVSSVTECLINGEHRVDSFVLKRVSTVGHASMHPDDEKKTQLLIEVVRITSPATHQLTVAE
jgi:hypothetical protein